MQIFKKIHSTFGKLVSLVLHTFVIILLLFFVIKKETPPKPPQDLVVVVEPPPPPPPPVVTPVEVSETSPDETKGEIFTNKQKQKTEVKVNKKVTEVNQKKIIKKKAESEDVIKNITNSVKQQYQKKTTIQLKDISPGLRSDKTKYSKFSKYGRAPSSVYGEGLTTIAAGVGATVDRIDIRITLSWTNENDLDLHVITPLGKLYFLEKNVGKGILEQDAEGIIFNDNKKKNRRVENVYWNYDTADEGYYEVLVNIYDFRVINDEKSTYFTTEIAGKGNSYEIKGNLPAKYGDDAFYKIASFEYKAGDIVNFKSDYSLKVVNLRPELKDSNISIFDIN